MSEPARHLRIVDTQTGDVYEQHPEIQDLHDQIKGLQRDVSKWTLAYYDAIRDKDAEARANKLWEMAEDVFKAWGKATGHTRSKFTPDRFRMIEPYLAKKTYGLDVCLRAVAGIAYDHWSAPRKNGTMKHFNEWKRIWLSADDVEERASAAPKGWRDEPHFAEVLERWGKP